MEGADLIIEFLAKAAWIVLGIGTVIQLTKLNGFLPSRLTDKIEQNKLNDIKEIFYKTGITPNSHIESMRSLSLKYLTKNYQKNEKSILQHLNKIISDRAFDVKMQWTDGQTSHRLKKYVDIQGLTLSKEINQVLADYIITLVEKRRVELSEVNRVFDVDCIVVHENAAPFLGYEVAGKLSLPLIYVKSEDWTNFSPVILHGQQVSADRKYYMSGKEKLTNAIFVSDFLMLGPHLKESAAYLKKYNIEMTEVFLLAYKNIDNSKSKLDQLGFVLNRWVDIDE